MRYFLEKGSFYSDLCISYALNQNLLQIKSLAYKNKLAKNSQEVKKKDTTI